MNVHAVCMYYVLCTFATKGRCNQLATDVIFKALMTTLEMGEGVPCKMM